MLVNFSGVLFLPIDLAILAHWEAIQTQSEGGYWQPEQR